MPLEGVSGYYELEVSDSSLQDAVNRFMNPDVNASERAITVATGQKPKGETGPPPSEVSLKVLNGNGEDGAADEAAVLLGQIGYQTKNGGNADNFDYFRTQVLYDSSIEDARRPRRTWPSCSATPRSRRPRTTSRCPPCSRSPWARPSRERSDPLPRTTRQSASARRW